MGPLALMAKKAGLEVCGSDLAEGAVSAELRKAEIEYDTESKQDGSYLARWKGKIDWFVYTSALPKDHAELKMAEGMGIRLSKRDELIAFLIDKLGLKLVAVAGTHGKTTTTSMIIWAALQLKLPVSYLVGTTLPFAEAGNYSSQSEFLVYEADEYDRNFLHFSPWLAVVTTVSYDHPDIYPSVDDYQMAFEKFRSQSEEVLEGADLAKFESKILRENQFKLAGEARRTDAKLAFEAVLRMAEEAGRIIDPKELMEILNEFPGAGRRFERIANGVYSDYGHHPEEVAATVEITKEEAQIRGLKGVVMVYEPHQNTRQHQVRAGYRGAFKGLTKLYWLPTYLTREDESLAVITPAEFIQDLENPEIAEPAEVGPELAQKLQDWHDQGYLVILMTAGPADKWLRTIFE